MMQPDQDHAAGRLYAEVAELFRDVHQEGTGAVLRLVEHHWAAMSDRPPNAHDAEICRLTMLAAAQEADVGVMRRWRTRALARFAAVGWSEGVGMVILGEALDELARANDGYASGRTLDVLVGSEQALDLLEEMLPFTVEPGSGFRLGQSSPTPAIVRRHLLEKRGLLRLVNGDAAGALLAYDEALAAAAGHERGEIKVQLGAQLATYVARGCAADPEVAAETNRLADRVVAAGLDDLEMVARANAALMASGRRDVAVYEIL